MKATRLTSLFTGVIRPGVYDFRSRVSPAQLLAMAADRSWRGFYLDGNTIHDKASFLQACAQSMAFPSYFGYNWDAFEEVITELAWAPARGYLLLYDDARHFAAQSPKDWAIARSILQDAVVDWQQRGVPFIVLLRRPGIAFSGFPAL
jgi:hypothetical protein